MIQNVPKHYLSAAFIGRCPFDVFVDFAFGLVKNEIKKL